MKKPARVLIAVAFAVLLLGSAAEAQVSVNLTVFPNLVPVPNYPVYYAPGVRANYFFYDGLYWVFNVNDGYWYSSSWYNGPWVYVEPVFVPQPILVVPYRYYGVHPVYWGGWAYDAPPRWGIHWGHAWEARRVGWDHWERHRYVIAPLPLYQRDYPRDRYPSPAQQIVIHNEHYKYVVKDSLVKERHNDILRAQQQGGLKANNKAERVAFGRRDEGKNFEGGGKGGQEKSLGRDNSGPQGQGPQNEGRVRRQQNAQSDGPGQGPQHEDRGMRQKGQHEGGNAQQQKGQHQSGHQKGGHEKGER